MLDIYLTDAVLWFSIIAMVQISYDSVSGKVLYRTDLGEAAAGCPGNPAPTDCTFCNGGTTPAQMQAVFPSEYTNDQCTDCTGIGGTYICDNSTSFPCNWDVLDATDCNGVTASVAITSGTLSAALHIAQQCGGGTPAGAGLRSEYSTTLTTPTDCSVITETLGHDSTSDFGLTCPGSAADLCDWNSTAASATVNAV